VCVTGSPLAVLHPVASKLTEAVDTEPAPVARASQSLHYAPKRCAFSVPACADEAGGPGYGPLGMSVDVRNDKRLPDAQGVRYFGDAASDSLRRRPL
jgi:hypothetical protein